jgi:hypothetical protein
MFGEPHIVNMLPADVRLGARQIPRRLCLEKAAMGSTANPMFRLMAGLTFTLLLAPVESQSADGNPAAAVSAGVSSPVVLEDAGCRIEFDRDNGGLRRIANRLLGDECLKGGRPGAMPFRIYADITKKFDIAINSKFQLVFEDPATICKTTVQPENCRLLEQAPAANGSDMRHDPFPHGLALRCLLRVRHEFKLNAERRVLAEKGKPLGKLLGEVALPCQPKATEMMLACA